jgi:signal transduction histidine kinase
MATVRALSEPGGPADGPERQLRTVVSAVTAGIVFKGPRGEILDFNPAAARILGVSRDPETGEIRSDPRLRAIREDGTPYAFDDWPANVALRSGQPVHDGVMGFAPPDGPTRWVRVNAVPLADAGAAPHAVVVSLDDITEERRAQVQLRQADRLTSLGSLAAGVAHEVNNPLACVQSNLEYLADALRKLEAGAADPPAPAALAAAIREALDGVARVKGIVRGLQLFAAPPRASARRPVDPRPQLDSAVALTRNEIQARARLEVTVPPSLPRVVAGDLELTQILVTLLVNGAQAIPEGRAADHVVELSASARGGRLELAVRDTGVGVAPGDLPRIFDPFFTTRPFQGGHGLGLPMCHGLVGALGGAIEVESTPGRGSVFRVTLPAVADAAAPPPRAAPPAPGPRARVLVLDDEPTVARSVARGLQSLHEVTVLTSAQEALRRVRAGESWDVILCDVMMPEMTAMDLEDALARDRPELVARLVYVTGGAFTDRSREFLASRPHLEKPAELAALRAAVAAALQRAGGAIAAPGAGVR